jgi:iron complex outermembrane recepter protein
MSNRGRQMSNMTKHKFQTTAGWLALMTATALLPVQSAFAQEAADTQDDGKSEIVVTATKRGQELQDTVQSVTVLRPEDTTGMQSTFDAFSRVPNITITSSGFLPTVRGLDGNGTALGGGGAVTGSNPRMTSYIDGVARTFSAVPDGFGGLWDIKQVEILRGSQSTTFGQNSLAGALVQVTANPAFTNEFAVQAGVRSEGLTVNGAIMANVALADNLAIRVTGQEVRGDSFVDYATSTGTGLTADDRKELSNERFSNYRAKVLFEPSPQTSITLAVNHERSKRVYPNDRVAVTGRNQAPAIAATFIANRNTVLSLGVTHEFDESWSFDGTVSRQTSRSSFIPPSVGNPDPIEYLDFTFDVEQYAFEPKLIYRADGTRTSILAGAYITTRDRTDFGAPGSIFTLEADDKSDGLSFFADATIQLAPKFDVLLGGRYIEDKQQRSFSGFGGFFTFAFDRKDKLFLPKIGVTYHLTDDAAVSLLGYKGYNAGGGGVSFVTLTPYAFKKETVETVELAARTNWLDGDLTVNANVFFSRLRDQQNFATGPAGPNDSIILNLARSKSAGLEIDASYSFSANSRVGASLGFLDTKITNFGSVANNSLNGNEFGQAPGVTASIYGNVELAEGFSVGGNLEFSGSRFTSFDNLPEDKLDSFALANINARYRIGAFTIEAFVNNLFDGYIEIQRAVAFDEQYVRRPRTFGANVTARF